MNGLTYDQYVKERIAFRRGVESMQSHVNSLERTNFALRMELKELKEKNSTVLLNLMAHQLTKLRSAMVLIRDTTDEDRTNKIADQALEIL